MAFKYLNDATIGAGQIASNVLPLAANVAEGTFGYDSVVGPVYARGSNWLAFAANVYSPSVLTAAGIQAAMAAAGAAGGGVVELPSGTIALSASLVPVAGVYLVGTEPVLNASNGIPDNQAATFTSGTILAPTGAFPAITWNTANLGAPASAAAFTALGLFNIGFKNLGFLGGTYGIFAGATNNASCWYAEFENLYFIQQSVWGYSLTNYQHCNFRRIFTFGCLGGHFHGIDVAGAILQPGNSTYWDLYCAIQSGSATNMLSRGITFITAGQVAASNNQFQFNRVQSNRFNQATTTQAATMANTSANISITDGTKWAVGMPVTVSATANGFTVNQIYFVVSVAANVLQIANTYGGAAIAATGATAVNLINQGFPCFEMIALSGASQTNGVIHDLDCEGGGTAAIVFQNCSGWDIIISQQPSTAQSTQGLCFRNVVNTNVFNANGTNTDFDNSSPGSALHYFGQRKAGSVGYMGAGFWYDVGSTSSIMAMGCTFDTTANGAFNLTGGNKLAPGNLGLGQKVVASGTATPTLNDGSMSVIYQNTNSGTTITLPTVSAANVTGWITIFNPTGVAQTINTNGTQVINQVAGRTSITLNPNASVRLAGSSFPGALFGYIIEGASSAMAAGVISAPT